MGIGALLMGDKVNSLEFINSAKMHIDLFEKPSPELSAGLLLLSSLLMLDCRLEGSRNVMALGMSMLSLLKEKKFSSDFFEIVERMGEHSRIEHNYTWDLYSNLLLLFHFSLIFKCPNFFLSEGRSINMKNLADSIDETKNYEARIHKFSSLANLAQYQALAKKPYRECLDSLERAKNLVLHLPFYKKHYEPLVLSIQATIDYCNGYHHLVHRSLPLFEEYSEQEFNFSSWILELTLIQIKIAYSLPIDKQMEKFRKISLRIPLILELLNQIINPSIERTPLIPCLPKLHEVPMQPLVPSSPLIEIINGNGAPFLEEFDPELLSQTEFNLSELEKPFDFGFNNSPSSMNCSNQCLSNSPIQTSSSPIVPSQITVFFKTIIQSQTFRVTPNLTCGQLIEQTPINNPHNYILVDKTGSTLPKNALIVDIFKESNPVVELKEKPFWS